MFSITLIKIKMCAFHSWSELPSIRIRLALHKINFDWTKFWFILVFSFQRPCIYNFDDNGDDVDDGDGLEDDVDAYEDEGHDDGDDSLDDDGLDDESESVCSATALNI